jgi:hypothetical protein
MGMNIFQETVDALGFNPLDVKLEVPRPSPGQVKRGKRVTNAVLRKLNKKEVPEPASATVAIMDDASHDTQEVKQVTKEVHG